MSKKPLCPGGPAFPPTDWRKEDDQDFTRKVKEVREATNRPINHCSWMLEMCYGEVGEAKRMFGLFRKWSYA